MSSRLINQLLDDIQILKAKVKDLEETNESLNSTCEEYYNEKGRALESNHDYNRENFCLSNENKTLLNTLQEANRQINELKSSLNNPIDADWYKDFDRSIRNKNIFIPVIKLIRAYFSTDGRVIGLREAKDLADIITGRV